MNQNIYNQSKIYKIEPITEHEEQDIYIGSTTKKYLSQRLQQHKNDFKKFLNNKLGNITIFNLFNKYGIDNFNIYLLENYNCNDINELRTKEGEYIKNLACINKRIECRTRKEYLYDNKEKIKEHKKEYDKERGKIKVICSCGCEIGKKELKRHERSNKHINLMKSKEPEQEQENNIINN